MPDRPVTEVAVAVVIDPQSGKFLLGSRPEGKPYAGYWEFPGGKLEKGESVHEALVRELREELDLTITDSVPWFVMEHDYPHAYVRLHFRRSWAPSLSKYFLIANQEGTEKINGHPIPARKEKSNPRENPFQGDYG